MEGLGPASRKESCVLRNAVRIDSVPLFVPPGSSVDLRGGRKWAKPARRPPTMEGLEVPMARGATGGGLSPGPPACRPRTH